ncbi:hypothetical protein A1O3_05538 [Capronia epimyces CBS 606.96]|uniref:Oxidoreductase n=1 Tax=Capronia epimyces CBS 606.96 TaxID=1182542 RepID=W9XXC5_9EURO|nr:uncharacterized protein A1O3_05538 [Capronia epimyces CBS 606.96]EXJ84863.1 hypothetical protein A1O3_05538 [Capronia epimyces CBS 606.96]
MGLDLSGVAFITGAGGSIGQAVAVGFARHGVTKIAGVDINSKGLEETAALLSRTYPEVEFLAVTADLTSETAVREAVQQVVGKFGAIHYAANNAGIGRPFGLTGETNADDYDRVMQVNVKGVWLCEKYELEQMVKQAPRTVGSGAGVPERGAIVNTASILGLLAMPLLGVYNTSKHAVLGLTRTDAIDYARKGVRVNAICPGFVDTPLLLDSTKKALASTIDRTPQGRLAQPEEVADAVCFLASGLASHITGVALPVDGGFTAT